MSMLNGWKAIAAYLNREERTAMRWSVERGLPVHRSPGRGRGTVYALSEEIEAWLAAARQAPEPVAVSPPRWWRTWRVAAIAALCVLILLMVGVAVIGHRGATVLPGEPVFADPAARANYLEATYDWNLRTRDSLARAVREYGQAISRDPRVAASYVGLANSYLLLREFGSLSDADAYSRAEAAARTALDLDPDSAAAHRALAFIAFWWQQDRSAARREFARALALGPDDALTHHWFATALSANGEPAAALREINRAMDLNPSDTSIIVDHALIAYLAGQRGEGVAALRHIEALQPDAASPHRYLALIALWEGRAAEYLDEDGVAARLRGDAAELAEVERLRPLAGDRTALEDALLTRAQAAAAPNGPWFPVAQIASLANKPQLAASALASACAAHEPGAVAAHSDLWLSRTLDNARITQLCGGGSSLD